MLTFYGVNETGQKHSFLCPTMKAGKILLKISFSLDSYY